MLFMQSNSSITKPLKTVIERQFLSKTPPFSKLSAGTWAQAKKTGDPVVIEESRVFRKYTTVRLTTIFVRVGSKLK